MAANVPTTRRNGMAPRTGTDTEHAPTTAYSAGRSATVVVGLILLPLGAIVLAAAALLQVSGWIGAVMVLGGASVLAAGIGLVSAPAHAQHLTVRQGFDRVGQDRGAEGRGA